MSTLIQLLITEMQNEAVTTRKMLARVPMEKLNWQPHSKSMKLVDLTGHIADLPGWVDMAIHTDELDFSQQPYAPESFHTNEELLAYHERSFEKGIKALEKADEHKMLNEKWTLRNGENIFLVCTRYELIRTSFCQIVHHRAQLGVCLRLLDIPIPGSYGPSADEANF